MSGMSAAILLECSKNLGREERQLQTTGIKFLPAKFFLFLAPSVQINAIFLEVSGYLIFVIKFITVQKITKTKTIIESIEQETQFK